MADQEQAALYAEATLCDGHTLSRLLLTTRPLRSGRFEWSMEPTLGGPGDWGSRGDQLPEVYGIRPLERLVSRVVGAGEVVVFEDALDVTDRSYVPKLAARGVRAVFKPAGDGAETFLVIDPARLPGSLESAYGSVGGAYRFVGVVAALRIEDFPPSGAEISDETLREVAQAATHVFFRGPSYDGLVIWTAPGGS